MNGASGMLLIVVGLIVLWAISQQRGGCFGGMLACLFGGSSGAPQSLTSNTVTASMPSGARITNQATASYSL